MYWGGGGGSTDPLLPPVSSMGWIVTVYLTGGVLVGGDPQSLQLPIHTGVTADPWGGGLFLVMPMTVLPVRLLEGLLLVYVWIFLYVSNGGFQCLRAAWLLGCVSADVMPALRGAPSTADLLVAEVCAQDSMCHCTHSWPPGGEGIGRAGGEGIGRAAGEVVGPVPMNQH